MVTRFCGAMVTSRLGMHLIWNGILGNTRESLTCAIRPLEVYIQEKELLERRGA